MDIPNEIAALRQLSRHIDDAFEAGATTQGRALLETALQQSRNHPAYHEFFRGAAARCLADDRDEQGRRLQIAAQIAPHDPFLLRNYGIYLAGIGQDEDALTWFDQALELDPADSLAMRKKGVSLSRLGRLDEALMWFDNAIETNPADSASMRNLGVSLSQSGRNEEALAWFDRALRLNPDDQAAMRQKGVSLSMLGRLDEALEWYDKALARNPGNVATLINKARTLIESGNCRAAVETYDRIIGLDRNNPYHYLEKAIALSKLGLPEPAAQSINQAFGLASPSEKLRRGKRYWLNRLGLESGRLKPASAPTAEEVGGEYGDIARVMDKTWEIFREDIKSFRHSIEEAKANFNVFINSSGMFDKKRIFLLGARKWNSFTPSLPLGEGDEKSVGGGYFLYCNGIGTVIDPGFNFLENFNAMGGRLADIHNIVVTHAHNDHTNDLESILTMFYQRNKQAGRSSLSGRIRSRRPVNLYINLGAFQKFSPILNLRGNSELGDVKVIAPGEKYLLDNSGLQLRILPANHDEIFSTTYSVGLLFTLPTKPARTVLFTGDTGLFPSGVEVTPERVNELEIGGRYGVAPGEVDYFIPHLGSIGENELRPPDRQEGLGEAFYPNHLGVQGLIRLITQLRPKYVFVSEFGEELKGFIALLMRLIQRCVREVNQGNGLPENAMPVILPLDLYFFCDLAREEIYCARTESFAPLRGVTYRHLDKNHMSQFYYEPENADVADRDEYFAMRKLAHACKINNGPFADTANRTHRVWR